MDKTLRISAATVLLGVATSVVGCVGPSLFGPSSDGEPTPATRSTQNKSYDFGSRYAHKNSEGNSLTRAWDRMKQSASKTMKTQPKVSQADAATSLSSRPEKLGPEIYVAAAKMYEARGKFDEARTQYRKALEIAPDDLDGLVHYARMLHRLDDFGAAIETYRRALSAHPKNAVVWNDLGLCYARYGKVPDAIDALDHAVKLKPASKLYRNNLAAALVEAGRYGEAYDHLARAHGQAVAHYNLGFLLQNRNERDRAIEHLREACRLDPSLTEARGLLAQLDQRRAVPLAQSAGFPQGGTRRSPSIDPERNVPADSQFQRGEGAGETSRVTPTRPAPVERPDSPQRGGSLPSEAIRRLPEPDDATIRTQASPSAQPEAAEPALLSVDRTDGTLGQPPVPEWAAVGVDALLQCEAKQVSGISSDVAVQRCALRIPQPAPTSPGVDDALEPPTPDDLDLALIKTPGETPRLLPWLEKAD